MSLAAADPSRPHWDGSNVLPAKPMIWENRAGTGPSARRGAPMITVLDRFDVHFSLTMTQTLLGRVLSIAPDRPCLYSHECV